MKKYIGFLIILAIFAVDFSVVSAGYNLPAYSNSKSIRITSPNNGGTFNASEVVNVKWKTKNVSYKSKIVIDIIQFGLPVGSLGYSLDKKYSINDGHEKFVLDDDLQTGYYNLRVRVVSNNRVYDISDKTIFVRNLDDFNSAPVISGVSGPQNLDVGQTGTWEVKAYDEDGGNLSYSVNWGEQVNLNLSNAISAYPKTEQSTTFTHRYNRSGNYRITFTVTNEDGESETASTTVRVTDNYPWRDF